jgi:hypothetical protein
MAVVFKYLNRNIALLPGAQIIQWHDGEPKPEPPIKARDPNLRSWSANLIGGKKMQLLGNLEVATEGAAIETAVVLAGQEQSDADPTGSPAAARSRIPWRRSCHRHPRSPP